MAIVDDTLASAINHHRDGDLETASRIYRQILQVEPRQADVLDRLGVLALQQSDPLQAARHFHAAAESAPSQARFHHHLGSALLQLAKTDEAIQSLQRAAILDTNNSDLHCELAAAFECRRDVHSATLSYSQAICLQPTNLPARRGLARTLEMLGRHNDAVEAHRQTLEIDPNDVETLNQYACLQFRQGDLVDAASLFKRALEADPQSIPSWLNLGSAFVASRQLTESEECFRRVTQIDADNTDAWLNLSNVLKVQHRVEEAARAHQEATRRLPPNPMSDLWQATLCPAVFPNNAAIDIYRDRLQVGLLQIAERGLSFNLRDIGATTSTPPTNLQFHGRDDRPLLETYASLFQNGFSRHRANTKRNGRPRVGFVVTSGHEAIFLRFLGSILNRLPWTEIECVVMCQQTGTSLISRQLDTATIQILPIPYQFDQAVNCIGSAKFDVLYHWETGTDVTNYFLPFCRLAPVQCTSVGNSETSGIAAIDYFITSKLYEPNVANSHYTEELIQLDGLGSLHSRAELPKTMRSRETFGFPSDQHVYVCAQKLQKIHPDFDHVLAEILRHDSSGIVALVENEFPAVGELLRQRFRASMSDVADRVRFVPKLNFQDYLSLLAAADVLLDPIYYGGGLTTHDAISLNRPVVTLPGQFARGRYAFGLYQAMDMNLLIADSPQHYAEIAVQLACESDFRESIESELRERSPVVFNDLQTVNQYQQVFELLVTTARSA